MEPMRLKRMTSAMEEAARKNCIFHLNWHPHNFGLNLEENLGVLRSIFESFARSRSGHGMRSLSMKEVVEALRGDRIHAEPVRLGKR